MCSEADSFSIDTQMEADGSPENPEKSLQSQTRDSDNENFHGSLDGQAPPSEAEQSNQALDDSVPKAHLPDAVDSLLEPVLKKAKVEEMELAGAAGEGDDLVPARENSLVLQLDGDADFLSESSKEPMPPPLPPPALPPGNRKGNGKSKNSKGKGNKGKNKEKNNGVEPDAFGASPGSDDLETASQASSSVSKSKGQGKGQKKQSKTNSRYCRGDGLYYTAEDMASKSAFCFRCKYIMDVLTKIAKAENKPEFIQTIKSNEKVLQNVIRKYREQVGDGFLKKRNYNGSLLTTLQEVAARSRILFDTEMEMMNEDAWLQFAMTEAGGRLSKSAAIAQWAQWRQQAESGEGGEDLIFDYKYGPLRVAVATRDTVHFQSVSWLPWLIMLGYIRSLG